MPMKLNVGVQRKVGQPNYGSLGASCNAEVKLCESLIFIDPEVFQQRVRQAFAACEQAVEEQLAARQHNTEYHNATHQGNGASNGTGNGNSHNRPPLRENGNGDASQCNGNPTDVRQATKRQLGYIRQLADGIHGLGVRKLEGMAQDMFDKPLAGLTSLDASAMIDCLKGIKDAELDSQSAPDADAT